jgi:hypothetical protein
MIFGIWFILLGYISHAVMSFALVGSLSAFFYFNVFGTRNKLFLGDTGSLIIGFTIAIFAIRFLEHGLVDINKTKLTSVPSVTLSILIIPLFDTIRVFMIRIWQGKSPFSPDRQHLHHRLIFLGLSHLQATTILLVVNIFFFGFSMLLQPIGNLVLIVIQIVLAVAMSMILKRFVAHKYKSDFLAQNFLPAEVNGKVKKELMVKNAVDKPISRDSIIHSRTEKMPTNPKKIVTKKDQLVSH